MLIVSIQVYEYNLQLSVPASGTVVDDNLIVSITWVYSYYKAAPELEQLRHVCPSHSNYEETLHFKHAYQHLFYRPVTSRCTCSHLQTEPNSSSSFLFCVIVIALATSMLYWPLTC